jgi:very-short-patch-repair endonuclease
MVGRKTRKGQSVMSSALNARELREAIADTIATCLKAYEVADFCVSIGLEPAKEGENPMFSKKVYVRTKLVRVNKESLIALARSVAEELGDEALVKLIDGGGFRGVDGELKNIIFASSGLKPRIVLKDALNNVIDIVEHRDSCLIYDLPFSSPGLTWGELVEWWASFNMPPTSENSARDLYVRLFQSLDSKPEEVLFKAYCSVYGSTDGNTKPALLPQVYLHYDPYTRAMRQGAETYLQRERMDFLLLFPDRSRVVIEVDGKQHYAEDDGKASPQRYSTMVAEDRRIRLSGYEVYRFSGKELMEANAPQMLETFFADLLRIHQ